MILEEKRREEKRREDEELCNCDDIKTILMLFIVLYHSLAFWLPNGWFIKKPTIEFEVFGIIARYLNFFHIYCFTLISGYIYCALRYERGRYNQYSEFVKKKVLRLLIPYIFAAIVWVMPVYCYFYHPTVREVFRKFCLAESPSQLWFLIMLFGVFIIFRIISDYVYKHVFIGSIIILMLYGIGLLFSSLPNIFQVWTVFQYLVFFYIGFLLRKYGFEKFKKVPSMAYFMLDICIFFIYLWFDEQNGFVCKLIAIGLRFLLCTYGAFSFFIILHKIVGHIDTNNSFFKFYNRNNMVIYLFHQQIIYFIIIKFEDKVNPIFLMAANFLGSFLLSSLIALFLSSFKITKFLISGKIEQKYS